MRKILLFSVFLFVFCFFGDLYSQIDTSFYETEEVVITGTRTEKKIIDILDKAKSLIDLRKKQIEKMDLLIKSKFIEMFGDPVTNPKGWSTKELKDITRKIGSGATPRGGKESYIKKCLIENMDFQHYNIFIKS